MPDLTWENSLWEKGLRYIAGIDEVGRGSWAGPLVVAAVILPQDFKIPPGLADSKQTKPMGRKRFARLIQKQAKSFSIVEISVKLINKHGIGKATHIAFRKAIRLLSPKPDFILVDAFYIKRVAKKNQKAIVKGDEKSASIACASILAKVYRDNLMKKLARKYPMYGLGKHKGYGTLRHQQAIKAHGFSKIHRTSYKLDFLIT
ncbi:ribonuclease HII [Candidatus Curtissbacteria bacterium RIFCSPHIGHO2_01_FULL_41_44]|uniref:Ribonuclease HII n=1 Tax=Candidatus Curtissbacteria bacterium RIFCSPLOWO2_01_FULL_42_50 TaxID=1797730 RepID=A0A1F5H4F2_9BACT|nr:MAG: ribonuclease HII [Candidatus Curtissbacteria bacterium RIFCSPHIGHO2_01_FULL_41_44]OGD93264.1 MAG: ribonuclease HII [Candidatus Curtissbacteria bacterium RIFCSPHIGHO2_02_FULL_42_58]OGD96904.1 MAG: ribonuclease HII [Candidatus Curtissbacteria bacterium RIFCSPHIGHO2_12_FULL_42_33]OGD98968.1 MAG: ribonuclease HII [Candidatus Curtissbacteria bacterium RIFCSPLOWO2_01_FULL_42_50]OGE03512.1 MAG: ribonuclease HII [Candidatus Curtissbacteria bacterium RIFCSPLOWO2_12_FULL_41_16]OGE11418.1 MAG: ri